MPANNGVAVEGAKRPEGWVERVPCATGVKVDLLHGEVQIAGRRPLDIRDTVMTVPLEVILRTTAEYLNQCAALLAMHAAQRG